MLARIVALLWFTTAIASGSPSIIGTWQSDNGKNYAEIYFRGDHSLILLHRVSMKNDELVAITDLGKQYGTWYIKGDKLKIDVTSRPSRERTQATVSFALAGNALKVQNIFDRTITDTYRRMHVPSCRDASLVQEHSLREEDLVGKWRCHYHTHDVEVVLETNHRAVVFGGGRRVFQGNWSLKSQTLTINKASDLRRGSSDKLTWKIIRKGARCLTVDDGWPILWTLTRVN